ncbi:synapsin-2-like [Rhinophrynus dorsalis]
MTSSHVNKPLQWGPETPQGLQSDLQKLPQPGEAQGRPQNPTVKEKPKKPPPPSIQKRLSVGPEYSSARKVESQPEPQPEQPQKAPTHPQLNKSQSLTNAFSFTQSSFFRSTDTEEEAKSETIRNLRKSFASLFSD